MKRAVFFDRDGVLNLERGQYTWKPEDFEIPAAVPPLVKELKSAGYFCIVITNQAGIAKGLYGASDVYACHKKLQEVTGGAFDALYFSPYHPSVTESLSRKPGSLMFERALAKFNIDPEKSWMIGDKERDLIPAKKLGIQTILLTSEHLNSAEADYQVSKCDQIHHIIFGAGMKC